MANPGRYDVHVGRAAIDSLFLGTGDTAQFGQRLARRIGVGATLGAPKRSGILATSHSTTGWLKEGPFHGRTKVINTAKYAAAVHDGVPGSIFPKRGKWLVIKVGYHAAGFTNGRKGRVRGKTETGKIWKTSVRGQRANPWLQRAADAVLLR